MHVGGGEVPAHERHGLRCVEEAPVRPFMEEVRADAVDDSDRPRCPAEGPTASASSLRSTPSARSWPASSCSKWNIAGVYPGASGRANAPGIGRSRRPREHSVRVRGTSSRHRGLCAALGLVGGLSAAIGGLAPTAGRWLALLDVASALAPVWALLGVLCGGGTLALGRRWLGGVIVLVSALPMLLFLLATSPSAPTSARPQLDLLTLNVEWPHDNVDAVLALVRDADPDVFVAQELTEPWVDRLSELHPAYPHRLLRPRFEHWGLGIYSKGPFEALPPPADADLAEHTLWVDLGCARLVAVHTHRTRPFETARRNRQLRALAAELHRRPTPTVLAGDFNVGPYSWHLRDFIEGADLVRSGDALGGTFGPASALTLDHVLVTNGISVTDYAVGRDVGSDHRPVRATLHLPACAASWIAQ